MYRELRICSRELFLRLGERECEVRLLHGVGREDSKHKESLGQMSRRNLAQYDSPLRDSWYMLAC